MPNKSVTFLVLQTQCYTLVMKNSNLQFPNNQLQLRITKSICLTIVELPIAFNCVIAKGNFMLDSFVCYAALTVASKVYFCTSDKLIIARQPRGLSFLIYCCCFSHPKVCKILETWKVFAILYLAPDDNQYLFITSNPRKL